MAGIFASSTGEPCVIQGAGKSITLMYAPESFSLSQSVKEDVPLYSTSGLVGSVPLFGNARELSMSMFSDDNFNMNRWNSGGGEVSKTAQVVEGLREMFMNGLVASDSSSASAKTPVTVSVCGYRFVGYLKSWTARVMKVGLGGSPTRAEFDVTFIEVVDGTRSKPR